MDEATTTFKTLQDAKEYLAARSIVEKKPFRVKKSDPTRLDVVCQHPTCTFQINIVSDHEGLFYISKSRPHSCNAVNPTIKKSWVCLRISEILPENPHMTTNDLFTHFKLMFGVDVPKQMLVKAKCSVKKTTRESAASFGKVKSFFELFVETNVGSTSSFTVNGGEFQRAFLCPQMCVDAFHHSTHVVALDGCHMKTKFGGVLLVMTVLDGNGNIFPCAIGLAESENSDTWSWFVSLVASALDNDNGGGVVGLSDREKGIERALGIFWPQAQHAFCAFHIQKNLKKHFNTALEGLVFAAARATSPGDYHRVIAMMKDLDVRAGEYIASIDPAKWCRAFFPARRFGHITSNIAESTNRWLEEARHLDPVGLFTHFIRRLNGLFERRRHKYALMPAGNLPKNVAKVFNKSLGEAERLHVERHTESRFEVQRMNDPTVFRVVDLDARTCSCGFFREHGIPCRHMCAAVLAKRENPIHLIIPERHLSTLVETYAGFSTPVDMTRVYDDGTKPPTETKRRGRRKEKRIPSVVEKKPKRSVRCRKCGGRGHNSRSCRAGDH